MIKLLKVFVLCYCAAKKESFRNKTFEVNSSSITVVSNIFKETKRKLITSLLNILYRRKSVTF